jgi:CBS domain-containing protein
MIVDSAGRLCGVITRGDLVRAIEGDQSRSVLDAGARDLVVTYPDELLHDAVAKMLKHDVGRLPVVSRTDSRELLGYLGRSSLLSARLRLMDDELVRESAWTRRAPAVPG